METATEGCFYKIAAPEVKNIKKITSNCSHNPWETSVKEVILAKLHAYSLQRCKEWSFSQISLQDLVHILVAPITYFKKNSWMAASESINLMYV